MTRRSTVVTSQGGCPDQRRMRAWVSKLSWSLAAQVFDRELGTREAAVLLPLWSKVAVGGARFEARIVWDGSEVARVVRGVPRKVTWRTLERGQAPQCYTATITVGYGGNVLVEGDWPDDANAPICASSLSSVVADGELAEWTMLDALEPFVRRQLHRASMSIGTELGGSSAIALYNDAELQNSVIDGLTIDRLAVGMLFGYTDAERDVPPVTRNLVRRYASCSEQVARVPLITYLETNVRRQADARVRTAIGDPMLGPRIRRIAATLPGDASAEDVLQRCIELEVSGREPLGIRRVREALTVAQRVNDLTAPHLLSGSVLIADERAEDAFDGVDTGELVAAYQRRVGLHDPDELWLSWQLDAADEAAVTRDDFYDAAVRACSRSSVGNDR